jgi:hypothetical protein
MKNGHFGFSRSVPEEIRQRLRNPLIVIFVSSTKTADVNAH